MTVTPNTRRRLVRLEDVEDTPDSGRYSRSLDSATGLLHVDEAGVESQRGVVPGGGKRVSVGEMVSPD
jgi:hypothetical protein